jgi:hypothetical protein
MDRLHDLLIATLARYVGLPVRAIDPTRPFYCYGLESRQLLQLIRELEFTLGPGLPPSLFFIHPTVEAIAEALARRSGKTMVQPGQAVVPPAVDYKLAA